MNAQKMALNSGIAGSAKTRRAGDFAQRILDSLWRQARSGLSTLLDWMGPVVSVVSWLAAAIFYAACAFVYLFVYKSHFPMGFTLCLATACLVFPVLYYAFVYLLRPSA